MAKKGIAAVGTGARLRGVLRRLLEQHGDEVEIRSISDDAPEAAETARGVFGAHIPAFADYRQAIDRPDIDWVFIGSRNHLHRDHCIDAFAAGKHVFCEKPMAITVDECEEIRDAHRASGKLFATGFVLRHAPLYARIHELVSGGELGQIVSMEANENLVFDHGGYIMRNWRRFRRMNGSHLLEKCSHDIDLINWIIGSVASRVASFGGLDIFTPANAHVADKLARPGDDPPLYCSWPSWEEVNPFTSEKDVEDNQVAIMEYRNRVRVTFHTNCANAIKQRRMLICGLEGTLEADVITGHIRWCRIGRNSEERHEDFAGGGHGGGDGIIVNDLARCMRTGEEPKAGGQEGFLSAITCFAIDQAMLEGRVVDVEPMWKRFGV